MAVQTTYTAYEPKWIGQAGLIGPQIAQIYPAEVPLWRTGDLLINVTTGTIVVPTGGTTGTSFTNATGAATPGPSLGTAPTPFNVTSSGQVITQGVVTVTGTTAAANPGRTLFGVVTYTITATTESQNSTPFIVNVAPGLSFTINVSATGAPAGATTYTPYFGFSPNTWARQVAATTLGTATAAIAYPLTNSVGVNKAAAAVSTGIVGMADCDSDAYYAGNQGATAGGSVFTGKRSLFGTTQSFAPGWTNDPFALPVVKLQNGFLEMTLVQAWNNTLLNAAVGFNIDSATGYFVADTSQTQAGNIIGLGGSPGIDGDVNDIGARVRVRLLAAAVI